MFEIVIAVLIGLLAIFWIFKAIQRSKQGKCPCNSSCSNHCSGCDNNKNKDRE